MKLCDSDVNLKPALTFFKESPTSAKCTTRAKWRASSCTWWWPWLGRVCTISGRATTVRDSACHPHSGLAYSVSRPSRDCTSASLLIILNYTVVNCRQVFVYLQLLLVDNLIRYFCIYFCCYNCQLLSELNVLFYILSFSEWVTCTVTSSPATTQSVFPIRTNRKSFSCSILACAESWTVLLIF